MIEIRAMTMPDSAGVAQLFARCFPVPWSRESIENMFKEKGYHSFLALEGESLAGYIGIRRVLDEADITNVCVDPNCRRKGTGSLPPERLFSFAEREKIGNIFLEVRASNIPALSLYEKEGFFRTGIRKDYYEKPREDAVLMQWCAGQGGSV